MAYEVIKRVGGRAYRYRVESYRDPETRRVRGKWTYLGRVEGEGTLSPERAARPNSRTRLLDALERLLELHELSAISTGMIANEASLAYGTFYRYFKDVDQIVREAMLRLGSNADRLREALLTDLTTADVEHRKIVGWIQESVANAKRRPGLVRAWYVTSNKDSVIVAERQKRFDHMVESLTSYIERLNSAGLTCVSAPTFNAYALVALLTAVVRECAVEHAFSEAKLVGILDVAIDLVGLPIRSERHVAIA